MSKFTIPIINLLLCSYLIFAYSLCWIEFDTWHDKTIAFSGNDSNLLIVFYVQIMPDLDPPFPDSFCILS